MNSRDFYVLIILSALFLSTIERIVTIPLPVNLSVSLEATTNATEHQLNYQNNTNLNTTVLIVKRSPKAVNSRRGKKARNYKRPKQLNRNELHTMRPNQLPSTLRNVFMNRMYIISKIEVDPTPFKSYYPLKLFLETVCMGSTIPYGDYKNMGWIRREVYKYPYVKRPFYRDLRKKMFEEAKSEECHSPRFTTFRKFQGCALQRNQRMELNVPKYPLHQIDKD